LTLSLLTQELWSYEEVVHLDPLQALKFSFPELWQEAPKISAHYEVTMPDLTLCILGCGKLSQKQIGIEMSVLNIFYCR
jgi:hypothetical protein